ncbi:MAG: F0F1 ATP synthase subunit alpha [Clostridiales bacterium]|nr:F0F1 ATP synthase subunit alpha [Clostridiales bacterium]
MKKIIIRAPSRMPGEAWDKLEEQLRTRVGECTITRVIDETLIGGFCVEIDGKTYDMSVSTQLQDFSVSMQERHFGNPIKEAEDMNAYFSRCLNLFHRHTVVYQRGKVEKISDGVVRIKDLPNRSYGEILKFDSDVWGITMDMEENGVGAVLLSANEHVRAGDNVEGTGHVVSIPVGDVLLGRVIDPIGRALDGLPLQAETFYPVERPAPALIRRRPVDTPLQTGIVSIDSMIPIGRGQRELIIGDRQTGKTSIALSTILNQKDTGVICIYCAIGQKASNVAQMIETLRQNDAMAYSIVVCATVSDSPAMQYLAPYAACSVAEYFMEQGRDVLVVYDDLSKHAVAYRTMSLLLHRPPGREAFPGDVFYLHSRLLERAACMEKKYGGGSMTALPIIETTGGNLSAYIPTNVISITDGQIYLESELFHSGIRPAVNTGLSVSRVGRAAQMPAMRKVSGTLRIDLAQYREMAVFSRFGADLDTSTRALLERGECLTNLFKQGKDVTYSLWQQVAMLTAYRENLLTDIPISRLGNACQDLFQTLRATSPAIIAHITSTGDLDKENQTTLINALRMWKDAYTAKNASTENK